MDPFKNQVDDRTSYTDLDEQFHDARLAKDSLTQGDWPSQIDRAAIDVTYGVALGTADSTFDHGATIGRIDFGRACGPHYVDGLRALAGPQSDLPQFISEHDATDIGDLAFRLNELRVELTKLGLDDSEIGDLNRATEALIEKLITQHGDKTLSRQPLQQPEAVADLLYQLFSDPAVTNYADILIDSITADTGNSIGGDSLLTHLDRPQMVTPLWDHQRRAITNWVANGTTGYVNMATATGKTVLGLAAIAHLFGDLHPTDTADIPAATQSPTGRTSVLIVAGQDLLLEQWQSEFDEHLNIPRSRTETDSDGDRRIELAWGDVEFRTAQELLAADPGLHYDLVILDEAHRYSSGRRDSRGWRDLFEDLTTNADSVLAMSGSIDDEWLGDSGVKDALEANLAQCIEFGITEAREQNVIADFRWDVCYAASNSGDTLSGVADSTTTLTPAYDTNTHKFTPQELTGDVPVTVPDTFETLRDLRSFAQSKDGKDARDQSESFDTFATAAFSRRPKRWQLNPPHDTIRQLLTEHVPERKAVVLVQSYAQADAVSEHLADWFDADTVYTPAKDEAAPYDTITAFKQADAGVLVGPGDVLGVGVDLPDAGIAVNLAKGGVNASLIQRIGRILRNPTGDKHAHFYHVVTIPGEADARLPGEDGRRLLRRAAEFRALGSRFREHPGFVAVTDTTSHILRELETAGARATIADNRDTSDMVDDDVARTLLDELIDEISLTLDDTPDQPVLTTYWQPESLTPGAMPVHDSVTHPESTESTTETVDTTPTDITVTVTDTDGTAIQNAAVIAETTTDSSESVTDADGTVTITPPTSGSNPSLFVSRAGYQNQTRDIPADEDTVTLTLPAANHTILTAHAADEAESDDTGTNSDDDPADQVPPDVGELRAELHRVDNLVDGYPTRDDIDTHSTYTATQFTDTFESWGDALHAADIHADQRVIDDVQRVADRVGGVPTMSDITAYSHYTPVTLGEHFGSFDAALAAAGVHEHDQTPPSSPNSDPDPTETDSTSTTQHTAEASDTTSTASSTAESQPPSTDTPAEPSTRDELINELQALAADWDTINRKLLYSVGEHHPDEYDDAFGSFDAALVEAGVHDQNQSTTPSPDADPEPTDTDSSGTAHETGETADTTETPSTTSNPETTTTETNTETSARADLISELQELASDWDTVNRKLLYSVGSHHPDEYDDVFGSLDAALVEAGLADTDTAKSVTTSQSEPDSDRDELITELQELASNRHRINQNLLYSVGEHHLEEYQDVFGSFDVALVEAGIADPDTVEAANKEQSTPSDKHGELITELQELAEDWDTIDRKLLYSVGSHHPNEYDDAFGSLDAALDEAGVADQDTEDTDQDTANTEPDTANTGSTDQSIPTDEREELLAELRELAEDWDTIDRKLLYSVGDHHPDEYDDAFGSVDAALDAAGVTDTIPTAADTAAETDEHSTNTTPTTATGKQPQASDSSTMANLPSNELIAELQDLADDWDTIDRKLLYSVGTHHPDEYEDAFGSVDAALVEAGVADPDTVTEVTADQSSPADKHDDQSSPADKHDDLIAELHDLAEDWDTVDRKLLYSVGDHHPDEYDDAFGSVDAALNAAGVTDTIPTADDTTAETAEHSTGTTPATTENQPQSTDPRPMAYLPSNELAELYVAFDRFQHLLTELAGELDTDGTTPMEQWAETVADHWGSGGPAGAPNYVIQQRGRNDFSIDNYRDAHGDGNRVTDYHHVEFAAVDDRIQHLLGDAIDDWDHAVPVAPESNTPLPIAITSTDVLDTAVELLDEFPAYPEADRPAPDDTNMDTDGPVLPDGRVDTLTVTVLDHDPNPGSKRDARLQVKLEDGTEVPLDIWSTHDLSLDWTVGDTYTIEQARHKSWETSTGTGHQLSSTKDFRVTPADAGSTGSKLNSNPPSRAGTGTNSTAGRNQDTGTSGGKSASSSGRSRTGSSGTPSRGELLDAIQRVGETIDRPLKASDVSDTTAYSANDVTRVFGSWQNALDSAGIDNEARLTDDLHRVADELGHRPTTTEMNNHGHVSATTYANYFGTYTAAIEQAFDEAGVTRSPAGTDTAGRSKSTGTDRGTSIATDATITDLDTGGGNQGDVGDDENTTTNSDDGIISDIMNDFDDISDSGSE